MIELVKRLRALAILGCECETCEFKRNVADALEAAETEAKLWRWLWKSEIGEATNADLELAVAATDAALAKLGEVGK